MSDPDSKSKQILDAAEELFARHGYYGVTMRQIAQKADVDVALTSYYFGKKLDLFYAVFNRRAEILSAWRREALRKSQGDKDEQTLEQIIEAFLQPLKIAQETGDPGWRYYLALLAQVMNSAEWNEALMPTVFDKRVKEFVAALKQALPNADDDKIHWCYHYVSGALALTLAQTGRIDRLSGGLCQSSDFDAAYDNMIPFVAAGFRSVCGE